nr:Chain P, ALA-CYS-GLN-LEU-ILE-ASN-THR-ASN-GLY-SER-TRP-HIS-ILE-CYS [Hepacivirus hominis]5EOC_Q Chain Q, ALA-CYS-GLN-LEU-ILE-ASN-THR-ASN-GLY-SER-TRP-HIS-ILE-CYS [Hepacivirus hominis]
ACQLINTNGSWHIC